MIDLTKNVALVVAGAVIGAGTTYFLVKGKYQALADEEIQSVKAAFKSEKIKEVSLAYLDSDLPQEDRLDTLMETLDALGYQSMPNPDNSIPNAEEVEKEVRDTNNPYVISLEEFMNDKEDFDKITISYYKDDETLCDERDEMIPDIEGTVGKTNLDRFGEGSDSKDTVYIRNEKINTDFEVCREDGSYSQMVLGVQDWERKFKNQNPRIKKMRDDE